MSNHQEIFCCEDAEQLTPSNSIRPHYNPYQGVHDTIYNSFLEYASRKGKEKDFMALLLRGKIREPKMLPPSTIPEPQALIPVPVLTAESLKDNPITPESLYVIHLASRQDFGPVFSHRYFACPQGSQSDWREATQQQWLAASGLLNLKPEKWDVKCRKHSKFYRLTLRSNQEMRHLQQTEPEIHSYPSPNHIMASNRVPKVQFFEESRLDAPWMGDSWNGFPGYGVNGYSFLPPNRFQKPSLYWGAGI